MCFPFTRQTWFECLHAAGLNIVEPTLDNTLEAWWDTTRRLVHKKDKRGFDALVMLTAWMLWKLRNARVFNNVRQQCNVQQLVIRIKEEFSLWKLARRGARSDVRILVSALVKNFAFFYKDLVRH
jgi:hypothetical protein